VPARLDAGGSHYTVPQFDSFAAVLRKAANWMQMQKRVRVTNVQSIDYKLTHEAGLQFSTLFVSVCLHRRNTDIRAKRITLYKMLDSYLLSVTIERFNSAFAQIRIDCPTG